MSKYDIYSERRKAAQARKTVPMWMTTAGYQLLYNKNYLDTDETPKDRFQSIAYVLSQPKYSRLPITQDRVFDLLWNGWLSLPTPALTSIGKENKGMPVSCTGNYIQDSVSGFFSAAKEIAQLTKEGFGTSSDLSDIRPRGAIVSNGLKAAGVLPVVELINKTTSMVSQGKNRAGAWAGYLTFEHGDFYEYCQHITHNPKENAGFILTDKFMQTVRGNDADAMKRLQTWMKLRAETGTGYLIKRDLIEKRWEAQGRPAKFMASNLCVAPETLVLTDKGHLPISTIAGQEVQAWNGEEFSPVQVYQTAANAKLICVTTDSGHKIECTPEHNFYINVDGDTVKVPAKDLTQGDKLVKFSLPVLEGSSVLDRPYLNGFYSGDGCYFKGIHIVYLYHDKQKLESTGNFSGFSHRTVQSKQNRTVLRFKGLKSKFFVPDASYAVTSRLDWLAGLLDADGCLLSFKNPNGKLSHTIQIASVEPRFLEEVQLMLQTLGVHAKVKHMRLGGKFMLPDNKGNNELASYNCKPVSRLLVTSSGINQLLSLGLICHRLDMIKCNPDRDASRFVKVASVVDNGRIADTYCFTEHKRGMGVFNGVLTGQCNEIHLPSAPDLSFTCVLSSLNLAKYDEWCNHPTALTDSFIVLNAINELFVDLAKQKGWGNDIELSRTLKFAKEYRALGMGVMGYHTYLQSKSIPFHEQDSVNRDIFHNIQQAGISVSKALAQNTGNVAFGDQYNWALCAVAPTLSTSLIMGGVSGGIEPVFSNVYSQEMAGGIVSRVNPVLLALMKDKGINSKGLLEDINANNGSVQHLEQFTDHEKQVFKTGYEIDQMQIVRHAGIRQQYLDQGQSLNLYNCGDQAYLSKVHSYAINNDNVLGLYYLRPAEKPMPVPVCDACDG